MFISVLFGPVLPAHHAVSDVVPGIQQELVLEDQALSSGC